MYLVLIAWLYVALMMAVAEATHTTGTVLGAVITFVLYGLLPMSVVLYLMGSPARRRAIKAKEAAERAEALALAQAKQASDPAPLTAAPAAAPHRAAEGAPASGAPDAGGQATRVAETPAVAAVREEQR
ncbi:hypothetical protein PSQ40_05450 [Curvibacter sp. HBC61]|uniref:Transmembrane protein n=1 Tax=Curvibacter cyanobacteriorum TaxID=3026422 RepID=A0ABT5MZ07_9BURK|nr:hypothetical protein [Curvibacter sp. HBC61]MDD0838012.1 hypothetical protein [Curvibacter sp. HBC61]